MKSLHRSSVPAFHAFNKESQKVVCVFSYRVIGTDGTLERWNTLDGEPRRSNIAKSRYTAGSAS